MFKIQEILRAKIGEMASFQHKGRRFFFVLFVYLLLITIAFVFLYPLIYMIATSLKTMQDIADPYVFWIPKHPTLNNFSFAYSALNYLSAAMNSGIIALVSSIAQVVSCSFIGYGFARYKFPARNLLFLLVLFTFIVPPQTIIVTLFMLYHKFGWLDTYYPFIIPSFFGQGLRGAIFIYIFRQFFKGFPQELEDGARIDGAGGLRTYAQIFLPLSRPAILVVFLFSFVWHWNDYYEPMIYIVSESKFTLPIALGYLESSLSDYLGKALWTEPIVMAGCFLAILIPLVLYAFAQKHFVSSIERTGLIG
jgi:multiple sugar transport system permease protein